MVDDERARRREIARRVLYWMRRRGMTRQVFADRMGRSVAWVDKIRTGDRQLDRLSVLERAAEVLGVRLAVLLDGEDARLAEQCVDSVEVAAVRAALGHYGNVSTSDDGPAPPVADVSRQLTYARAAFQSADLAVACGALPALILDAQNTQDTATGANYLTASRLLVQTYQLATSVLLKFGETSVAWLAADRAMYAARHVDDLVCLAGAARACSRAMLNSGQGPQAVGVLLGITERLRPHLRDDNPALLSLYGMLLLRAEIASARVEDPVTARDMNREAAAVAARLATDRNDHWTSFGPTNVQFHRLAALVRLRDAGAALDFARIIDATAVAGMPRERRVNYLLDIANANRQRGRHSAAVAALVQADRTAPEEVRCRPVTRFVIADLLKVTRAPSPELRRLGAAAGLTV